MGGEMVVLVGGPGDTQQAEAAGPTVVWHACLYERTSERQRDQRDLRVFEHRPDCCDGYGRGDVDRCE